MDGDDIHGWQALLVVKIQQRDVWWHLWKFLSSMDIPSIHGWTGSTSGMHHGHTGYQIDSPVGLDLKLAKRPPKDTLKLRRSGTVLSGFSGVLLGPVWTA